MRPTFADGAFWGAGKTVSWLSGNSVKIVDYGVLFNKEGGKDENRVMSREK